MRVRDSGMPDVATWDGFFDPGAILDKLAFDDRADVVDFGCGYGTFTVAAAARTTGVVNAFDLDPEMVAATATRAASLGLMNVRAVRRDFDDAGTGLPDASVGYAMLFNVMHAEEPMPMLLEARRVLVPRGLLAVSLLAGALTVLPLAFAGSFTTFAVLATRASHEYGPAPEPLPDRRTGNVDLTVSSRTSMPSRAGSRRRCRRPPSSRGPAPDFSQASPR